MSVSVSTFSRVSEPSNRVPAAAFVPTGDDIRRSGVTSLPDALRLVPGAQVARMDASRYAIGIRGFADRLSRAKSPSSDPRDVSSLLQRNYGIDGSSCVAEWTPFALATAGTPFDTIASMPPPDFDAIESMLVVLENTLAALDNVSAAARQLVNAETSGKPLSAAALEHYEQDFRNLAQHRERLRDIANT